MSACDWAVEPTVFGELLVGRRRRLGRGVAGGESRGFAGQLDDERWWWTGCAMLSGKEDVVGLMGEVEVRVAPCVQIARASERLAVLLVARVFAGMVHQGDRGVVGSLQRSETAQDFRHCRRVVLVGGVQSDQRVE